MNALRSLFRQPSDANTSASLFHRRFITMNLWCIKAKGVELKENNAKEHFETAFCVPEDCNIFELETLLSLTKQKLNRPEEAEIVVRRLKIEKMGSCAKVVLVGYDPAELGDLLRFVKRDF